MRLTGAALLTGAGLMAGLLAAGQLRDRLRLREELCRMLEMTVFELDRFRTPLPDMYGRLAQRLDGEAGRLCAAMAAGLESLGERDVAAVWAEALRSLPERERRILLPLGQVLGRYGAAELGAAAAACREDMERARDEAGAELRDKGRIYVGLSAAGAAAVAVLLL